MALLPITGGSTWALSYCLCCSFAHPSPDQSRPGGLLAPPPSNIGATWPPGVLSSSQQSHGGQSGPPPDPCAMLVSLAVVGRKELLSRTVNVRTRNAAPLGERSLQEVLGRLQELRDARVPNAEELF